MRLVLLGPPGSGKGTLGNMFAQSKNIPHLSTGDMLRKEMAGKTLLGEKIAPIFNVSKKEIVRRLSGRRVCIQCGKIYTVDYAKGVCEKCGGRLGVREDDKPEVVEKRLEVYERQTEPLIGYYREKDVILEINGEQPPEKVLKDVLAILK